MRTEWMPEQVSPTEPYYVPIARREAKKLIALHAISTREIPSRLIEDVLGMDLLDRATGEGRR